MITLVNPASRWLQSVRPVGWPLGAVVGRAATTKCVTKWGWRSLPALVQLDELDAGDVGLTQTQRCMSAAVMPERKRSRLFSGRFENGASDRTANC